MDNAELNLGIREYGLNSFREAFKAINTGDQDIFHTPVRKICQNLKPKIGPFMLGNVQAEHFLPAFDVYAQNCLYSLSHNFAVFADLVMNGIKPNNRINRCQRPGLPFFHRVDNLVRNGAQRTG